MQINKSHQLAFPDCLQIRHGPRDLLRDFFAKADHAARQRGVYMSVGTVHELAEVNAVNRDSWMPLTTSFRAVGGINDDNCLVFLGRDVGGRVVATQAARIFDWSQSNFKAEAESLRFFYANPERDQRENESCTVTADGAEQITGRVALGGGIWYHPEFRGRQLSGIITRMGRAYAYALWNYDVMIATITQNNLATKFDRRTGYRDVIPSSMVMRHSETKPDGDLLLALAKMTPAQLIDDVYGFMISFDAQVDRVVGKRRAY